jgi:hypothetical protein
MARRRFILTLIIVPVVVSFLVTMLVLWLWDSRREPTTYIYPTDSPTSQIPPLEQPPASEGESAAAIPEGSGGEQPAQPGEPDQGAQPPGGPGCENPTHEVASGETLSGIAELYDVAMEDIIIVNPDMPDPEFLSIGQTMVIPVCGVPTPTPTPTPTNTPVPTPAIPTPIPTPTPAPLGEVEVEIAEVRSPGDVTTEAVIIANLGSQIDLEGWVLSDEDGNEFTFPGIRLLTIYEITVYTGVGQDTPIDLHWGLSEAVWESGETATLYDQFGGLQASYEIP